MTRIPTIPLAGTTRKKRELSEEDRKSLIRQAGETALGGIAAVGNFLDLPGSMARDVLGGENPFDQLLSPFKARNRLTGRDLLRRAGIVGSEDTWWNAGPGIALEIATDPLSYLTLGASALGKGGKAVKAAGILDEVPKVAAKQANKLPGAIGKREALATTTIDDLMKEPGLADKLQAYSQRSGVDLDKIRAEKLGGGIGVGLPFRDPLKVFASQKVAKGLDEAAEMIRYGKYSPIRHIAGAFGRRSMGKLTAEGQKTAHGVMKSSDEAVVRARKRLSESALAIEDSHHFDVDFIMKNQGMAPRDAMAEVMRRADEMTDYLEGRVATYTGPSNLVPAFDDMTSSLKEGLQAEEDAGLVSNVLQDMVLNKYFPRQETNIGVGKKRRMSSMFDTTNPFTTARKEILQHHVGGTNILKRASLDDRVSGIAFRNGRKGKVNKQDLRAVADILKNDPDFAGQFFNPSMSPTQSDWNNLAHWFAFLDPKYADAGIPVFEVNPMKPLLNRLETGYRAVEAANGSIELLAKVAEHGPYAGSVFRDVNLEDVVNTFAKRGSINADKFKGRLATALNVNVDQLKEFHVPESIAKDATSFLGSFTDDGAVSALKSGFDAFTNLFKTSVTAIWPAFHTRNLVSGMFQNYIGDAFDVKDIKSAHDLLTGKEVKGLPKFLGQTPREATDEIRKLAFAHGVVHPHMGLTGETIGDALKGPLSIPGSKPILSSNPIGSTFRERWNPLNTAGVRATGDVFTPSRIGRDVGSYVEGIIRLQPFITLVKRGVDPQEAARRVLLMQVDYRASAPMDPVMRRLLPFWSFTRGSLPFHVEQLVSKPQGKLGRTITTLSRSHDPHEVTPDYVAETASIPLGRQPDGSDRYVTGLGLMFEDPLSFLGKGTGGFFREAASRLHPAFKVPIELATGQSLFQSGPLGGRPLEDLDPTIGRTIANIKEMATGKKQNAEPFLGRGFEYAASNLPFVSRLGTTARTLTDTRKNALVKALNAATGFKVSDISPAAQKALLSERAAGLMKKLGGRDFRRVYIPSERLDRLSPEKRILAEQLNALLKEQTLR